MDVHQEKLLKLVRSDAAQLLERAEYLPQSRAKSIFITHHETAMLWLEHAIKETPSTGDENDHSEGRTRTG